MSIAALIVLNTMMGSVYERESEISIYGAMGWRRCTSRRSSCPSPACSPPCPP
jgi:ABC-type antimicrobial peptide transport system permease subunit